MPVASDRVDFIPPPASGNLRALLLALGAHGLLLLALTWGVNWKRQDQSVTAEAELWSALPQTAAPKLVAPPPPPPPAPTPRQVAPPPDPSAAQREADIALERDRQQKAKDRAQALRQQELEKAAQKKEADEREKARRDAKLASDQKADQKVADKKAAENQATASAQKKLEATRAEDEKKQAEARRQEQISRAQGQAGATGDASSTGKAQTSSGPSAGYAGRIRARIKPNIVFTDDIAGNPEAEVSVRVAPDGTIVGKRLSKSSGNKAWDEAVLKAIDKTEILPRDTDGRVVPEFPVSFRPRD